VLAVGVNGDREMQTFTITYADGESASFSQSLNDWASPRKFSGESVAFGIPYRLVADGSKDSRTFYGYGIRSISTAARQCAVSACLATATCSFSPQLWYP